MEDCSRRLFLQVSASAALAGFVSSTLADETRNKIRPLVIFFQGGAQSPYEFVSPLLDSPSDIRGSRGVTFGRNKEYVDEGWPMFAKVSNHVAVIRSLDAGNVSHDANPVVGQPGKHGEMLANGGLPHPFVELPSIFGDRSKLDPTLGMHIRWDDEQKRFVPPELQPDKGIAERLKLLKSIERPMDGKAVERMERNRNLAASLLTGEGAAICKPFEKAAKDHVRYGSHAIGDACALASSMAQSGAGVTIVYNEFHTGWDLHSNMKDGYESIIPPTDHALAELIEDARRHGFVLLMTTDHGRTPLVNSSGGRDHHNVSYAVLAGGKTKEGAVHGAVDRKGNIKDGLVAGKQLMATVLHSCGVEQADRVGTINEVVHS